MVIRIEQGQGRRDRYVMLSSQLVDALEKWRALGKPKQWLFPGNRPENHITRHAVEKACREARRRSFASRLRHMVCVTHSCSHAGERKDSCARALLVASWVIVSFTRPGC